jgi:hypothetical protein
MSGSQKFRLRLSPQLAAQVQTMAELRNVPFAAVLRLAVEELMADPDHAQACIAARYGNIPDSSTPEQRQRANDYLASLEPHDWSTMVRGMID